MSFRAGVHPISGGFYAINHSSTTGRADPDRDPHSSLQSLVLEVTKIEFDVKTQSDALPIGVRLKSSADLEHQPVKRVSGPRTIRRFKRRMNVVAGAIPTIVNFKSESNVEFRYDNHPIAHFNDHVVRIAIMTEPYRWHFHPNSDETFMVLEGAVAIEFDQGIAELKTGELLTVPGGVRHRTLPIGERSVNPTLELADPETVEA
jgi:mannose-6-phosphate isomerase-like protein (cupin superfamily)